MFHAGKRCDICQIVLRAVLAITRDTPVYKISSVKEPKNGQTIAVVIGFFEPKPSQTPVGISIAEAGHDVLPLNVLRDEDASGLGLHTAYIDRFKTFL